MPSAVVWIKQYRWVVLLAAAVLIALLAAVAFSPSRGETPLGTVTRGTIMESVYGIGTVKATRSFQLRFGVAGAIRALHVKEGDTVRRGQRIVEMDGVSFQAPFDGTITALPFNVGETVFPQAVVYELVDLNDRYLIVALEQEAALRVRRGQPAKLSFDSMRSESYDGTVQAVYSHENSFLVRIGIENLPPQILPGMTADVAIGIRERPDVLLVPVAAVQDGRLRVRRSRGGAETVAVTLGVVDGAMAEIVSGDVREGDRVYLPRTRP